MTKNNLEMDEFSSNKRIKYSSRINDYDKNGFTQLHLAVIDSNLPSMVGLIYLGADVKALAHDDINMNRYGHNEIDYDAIHKLHLGNNIAHFAMQKGDIDIIKYLAENHLELFKHRNQVELTPLALAAADGHLEAVRYFLEEIEPKLNTLKHDNDWTLVTAIRNGHNQIIELLLEHGCNPNPTPTNYHPDPYMPMAGFNGYDEHMVDLLFKYKANINAKGYKNKTGLYSSVVDLSGFDEENLPATFLAKNADLTVVDHKNRSIIDEIATVKDPNIQNMLWGSLLIDLICGDIKIDSRLADIPKDLLNVANKSTMNVLLDRITHKIIKPGAMSVEQMIKNIEGIIYNANEFDKNIGAVGIERIKAYIQSFKDDIDLFAKHNGEKGIPSLFKLALNTAYKSKQWEEAKDEAYEHAKAKAGLFTASNYVERATKQDSINKHKTQLDKQAIEKGTTLVMLNDLFSINGVVIKPVEYFTEQESNNVTSIGENNVFYS